MAFDDRLGYLLLGMGIGFVLGYLVRLTRDIKEELDVVKEEIESGLLPPNQHNEQGFMRHPIAADIAILLVVGLSVVASFVSQKASHDSQASQDRYEHAVYCNQKTLTDVLAAVNERSTYSADQAKKNINLVKSQGKFLGVLLHKPPYSEARRANSIQGYYGDLQNFLEVAAKSLNKVQENPLPTVEDFRQCLHSDTEGEQ